VQPNCLARRYVGHAAHPARQILEATAPDQASKLTEHVRRSGQPLCARVFRIRRVDSTPCKLHKSPRGPVVNDGTVAARLLRYLISSRDPGTWVIVYEQQCSFGSEIEV
jgi:hypothetical protein